MIRATLTFDLPEDKEAFDAAKNGENYARLVESLFGYLRGKIKYAGEEVSDDTINAYEDVRAKILELMSDLEIK